MSDRISVEMERLREQFLEKVSQALGEFTLGLLEAMEEAEEKAKNG